MTEWLITAGLAVGGWVFSVEKRLAKLDAIKEDVGEIKSDLKQIAHEMKEDRDKSWVQRLKR